MRIAWIALILISYAVTAMAQFLPGNPKPKFKIVKQDTIHITGIVYDAEGAVVPRLTLYSKNKELVYSGYYLGTDTDKEGKFSLKGALFHDTLTISPIKDLQYRFIVNGSRYLEIHLPKSYNRSNVIPPVEMIATRKHDKKISSFKVVTNELILDYYGIVGYATAYPFMDKSKYIALVKSKLAYPIKAIEHNIEGEVEIEFTIERAGELTNYRIIKGIGYGCDEAVITALKQCPKWVPAISPNGSRKTQSSITIQFKLTDQ